MSNYDFFMSNGVLAIMSLLLGAEAQTEAMAVGGIIAAVLVLVMVARLLCRKGERKAVDHAYDITDDPIYKSH